MKVCSLRDRHDAILLICPRIEFGSDHDIIEMNPVEITKLDIGALSLHSVLDCTIQDGVWAFHHLDPEGRICWLNRLNLNLCYVRTDPIARPKLRAVAVEFAKHLWVVLIECLTGHWFDQFIVHGFKNDAKLRVNFWSAKRGVNWVKHGCHGCLFCIQLVSWRSHVRIDDVLHLSVERIL